MRYSLRILLLIIIFTSTYAMADTFIYTDTTYPWSANGNTITYNIEITLNSGNKTGSAVFDVTTTADTRPPSYYGVEFDFKLSEGNTTPTLSNLTSSIGTGPWTNWMLIMQMEY
jgi:hypothetical protein